MALAWVLRFAKKPGVVVGVPGAGTFKKEWVSLFESRDVILCYDNDDAGSKGTRKAIRLLSGVVSRLREFQWEESDGDGRDIRDFVRTLRRTQ